MGRTQVPLTIVMDDEYIQLPQVQALKDKGHTILSLEQWREKAVHADLILHHAAWAWNGTMWPYLETALKGARARKKAKKSEAKS